MAKLGHKVECALETPKINPGIEVVKSICNMGRLWR